MKKLNLLEPALIKGYARFNNVDQEVSYLRIDELLNHEALKADIALGAKQFKECLSAAEKGLSRVVVIRAKNEEDGLMAVNYLSGICNSEKGVHEEDELEESLTYMKLIVIRAVTNHFLIIVLSWQEEPTPEI